MGYFREDYEHISSSSDDYLDEHNGRTCITPEYPNGTYAYFCTVDENWNSAYPYAIGPTFYGVFADAAVTSINESTTIYTPTTTGFVKQNIENLDINIFPNPSINIIAIQVGQIVLNPLNVDLIDISGKLINRVQINAGSTIAYFDVQTVYEGAYFIKISNSKKSIIRKVIITRD